MPGKKCIVRDCKLLKTDTFHRVPRKADNRTIWLDRLNLPDSANGRVCSKHFEPSDFELKGGGHFWLKRNTYPKERVELVDLEVEMEVDDDAADTWTPMRLGTIKVLGNNRKDDRRVNIDYTRSTVKAFNDVPNRVTAENRKEWKEFVINVADLPRTGVNDTVADLQMNCSVHAVYRSSVYEEHNYSKFSGTIEGANTLRDWILHRRRELLFDIKFCKISSGARNK